MRTSHLTVWLLFLIGTCCVASEDSLYRQLEPSLAPARLIALQAPEGQVPAILAHPERPDPVAAAVLIHGYGQHADWPTVVRPLRETLTAAGWTVLSLSMPVAAADAPMRGYGRYRERVLERMGAAVEYLKAQELPHIALVGQDIAGIWALDYLSAQIDDEQLMALVAISLSLDGPIPSATEVGSLLESRPYPLLDIYAERDRKPVLQSAAERKRLALAADTPFRQQRIVATDEDFTLMQNVLARSVRGWLEKVLAQQPPPEEEDDKPAMDANAPRSTPPPP